MVSKMSTLITLSLLFKRQCKNPCFQIGLDSVSSPSTLRQLPATALNTPSSWIFDTVQYSVAIFLALTSEVCFSFNLALPQDSRIHFFIVVASIQKEQMWWKKPSLNFHTKLQMTALIFFFFLTATLTWINWHSRQVLTWSLVHKDSGWREGKMAH